MRMNNIETIAHLQDNQFNEDSLWNIKKRKKGILMTNNSKIDIMDCSNI